MHDLKQICCKSGHDFGKYVSCLTAIGCYGSFNFMVMHFRLTNAPATFQRFMNTIFTDLLDCFVVVYLDNILIFSKDPAKHKANICEVLSHLHKYKLFAKAKKGEFSVDTTKFLSFIILPSSISMSQLKVNTILRWPTPCSLKQVQSFLGFSNFYCHSSSVIWISLFH